MMPPPERFAPARPMTIGLALLVTSALSSGQQSVPAVEVGVEVAVEEALRAEFERQELVGLAVAIVDGETITEFHLGFADRAAAVAVGPRTMFRWASISKPLTAVRAMQLAGAEALDLDADVRTLVPEFPEKPWPITARQLLGHLGGVVHYTNGEVVPTRRDYEVEHPFEDAVLALHTFDRSPLIAEPGTKYAYTTHGYLLLGAAVQRAGGAPFRDQIREHVAEPLGMTSLRPDYQWEEIPHRAVGYRRVGGRVVRSSDTDVSWKLAGGGFISTVGDLARFARGLCGEELLPRATLDVMWTRQRTRDGEETSYGLGFGVSSTAEEVRIGHTGSQEKTRTLLQVRPDAGHAVVVMTNSEYARPRRIGAAVWRALDAGR
ncbi:MAG: serine hydrolase domain-containing protein [Planctomycetota bacterium]